MTKLELLCHDLWTVSVDLAFGMFIVWIYWFSLVGGYKENKQEGKKHGSGVLFSGQCSYSYSINILPPPKPTCKTSFVQRQSPRMWEQSNSDSLGRGALCGDESLFGGTRLRCRHWLDCLKKLGLTRWPWGDGKPLGKMDKCGLFVVLKCFLSTCFVTIHRMNNTPVSIRQFCH